MQHRGKFSEVRADKAPWNGCKGVVFMAAAYIASFFIFVTVGKTAPPIFNQNVKSSATQAPSFQTEYIITNMEKWHQLLYLRMRIALPTQLSALVADGSLTVNNGYAVRVWGSPENSIYRPNACQGGCITCPDGVEGELTCVELVQQTTPVSKESTCSVAGGWCDWVGLVNLDFVEYHTYYYEVQVDSSLGNGAGTEATVWPYEFELIYLQEDWTWFQNAWFYTWVIIILCFMLAPRLGFFVRMVWLPRAQWSRQQKWTSALLISLVFFNNPFYAAMIWSSAPGFWYGVYGVALATFLAILMIFWLDLFDDIGSGAQSRGTNAARQRGSRGRRAVMVARVWIVGLVWLCTILLYVFIRLRQAGDPTVYTYNDLSTYTATKVVLLTAASMYLLWLVWRLVVAAGYFMRLPGPYRYLFCITVLTVAAAMTAVYMGVLAPDQYGAVGFCVVYGMFNIYVMTLGWLYAPTGAYYKGVANGDEEGSGSVAGEEEAGGDFGTAEGPVPVLAAVPATAGTKPGEDSWGLSRQDSGLAAGPQPSWAVEEEEDGLPAAAGLGRRPRAPYV